MYRTVNLFSCELILEYFISQVLFFHCTKFALNSLLINWCFWSIKAGCKITFLSVQTQKYHFVWMDRRPSKYKLIGNNKNWWSVIPASMYIIDTEIQMENIFCKCSLSRMQILVTRSWRESLIGIPE